MAIHPTAIIDSRAELGPDVEIGPHVVIDGPVKVGAGTTIRPFAVLTGSTTIGQRCRIFSHAVIGEPGQDKKYGGEESHVTIGDDCILREGVTVHKATGEGAETVIGDRCFLMSNSHVGHNCILGNDVTLISGCLLGGHVTIGDRAVLSGNTAVHQFVRIGTLAMVAGVAPIVQDIPPFTLTDHEGHIAGINLVGLKRAGFNSDQRAEVKEAYRLLYRESLPIAQVIEMLKQEDHSEVLEPLIEFLSGSSRGLTKGSLRLRKAA